MLGFGALSQYPISDIGTSVTPPTVPEITPSVFPGDVKRPGVLASACMAFAMPVTIILNPFVPSPATMTTYPHRVERPALHASRHHVSSFVGLSAQFLPPFRGDDYTVHPDRVERPFLHASQQRAYADWNSAMRYVQGAGADTSSVAFAQNNRSGNLLVLGLTWFQPATAVLQSITDTQGNAWKRAPDSYGVINSGGDFGNEIWFAENAKPGANTVTANFSTAPGLSTIIVSEFAGVSRYAPFDKARTQLTVASATMDTGSQTTREPNELAFAYFVPLNVMTAGVFPWKVVTITPTNGEGAEYRTDLNGTFNATATQGAAVDSLGLLAFFRSGDVYIPPVVPTAYPDRVLRPSAQQAPPFAFYPFPVTAVAALNFWWPSFADTIARPTFGAHQQQATALQILTAQFLPPSAGDDWTTLPDTIARPTLHASQQQHAASLVILPNQFLPPSAGDDWAVNPDAVTRPAFPVTQQMAWVGSSKPEQKRAYADAIAPAWLARREMPTSQQMATARPERREVYLQPAPVWFPDAVTRPAVPVTVQPSVASLVVLAGQFYQPTSTSFPAAVARPTLHTSAQQAVAFYPVPIAAVVGPTLPFVVFPDGVVRPAFHASAHLASALVIPRDRFYQQTPISFPDRVVRPAFRAEQQRAFTTSTKPERTSVFFAGSETQPERVLRPSFSVTAQLAATSLSPKPEQKRAFVGSETFPDRVTRPALPTASQQATALVVLRAQFYQPTPTSFPDAVRRPIIDVAQQQAFAYVRITPPIVVPTIVPNVFPNSIRRPWLEVGNQVFLGFAGVPIQTFGWATKLYPSDAKGVLLMLSDVTTSPLTLLDVFDVESVVLQGSDSTTTGTVALDVADAPAVILTGSDR